MYRVIYNMNKEKEDNKATWWQPSLILFGRLSGWIGGPVILALFLGKWLDNKYGTAPKLFLLCVGVAFVVSMLGIVKDATSAMKEIDAEAEKAKKIKTVEKEIKSE